MTGCKLLLRHVFPCAIGLSLPEPTCSIVDRLLASHEAGCWMTVQPSILSIMDHPCTPVGVHELFLTPNLTRQRYPARDDSSSQETQRVTPAYAAIQAAQKEVQHRPHCATFETPNFDLSAAVADYLIHADCTNVGISTFIHIALHAWMRSNLRQLARRGIATASGNVLKWATISHRICTPSGRTTCLIWLFRQPRVLVFVLYKVEGRPAGVGLGGNDAAFPGTSA